VKETTKYVDEVSGKEFNDMQEAIKSENKNKAIEIAFKFYGKHDNDTEFTNGGYCYKRDEAFYNKLIDTLMDTVKEHEPWIAKQYDEHGGLKPEYVKGQTMLGRYLSDNNSSLYSWWCIQSDICTKCYRQYGQTYYAINCKCDNSIPEMRL